MKKYLLIISVLAFVACDNSNKAEEAANEARQQTIDSIAAVNANQQSGSEGNTYNSTTNNVENNSTAPANNTTEAQKKKGMSNTTKGALIGTGVGIVGGAATGAAVSDDKAKGAVIGGVVGGAVGSGVGYGIGADKDKKAREEAEKE